MSAPGFVHDALVYRDDADFVEATVPFLLDGIRAGGAAFAVVPGRRVTLLREALGSEGEKVPLLDMTEVGANPARIIPALRDLVDTAGGRPVHGVGEPVWAGRSAQETAEALLHEALLNLAFADTPGFRLRCPYDVAVGTGVLDSAHRSHPIMDGRPSGHYDVDYPRARFAGELPAPAEVSDITHFSLDDLPDVRDLVTARASAFGLSRDRALDLALAVNEIVTNSVCHGGERGTLRVWTDQSTVTCEITDGGHITDLLVGRHMPLPSIRGGRGVWLANHLCDLIQIRSSAVGTIVRLHMRRQSPA
ncbi:MAG: sensor histidine kinase [Actinomycetota bacterium]|nr:sensor histidine kinase [Actinomycetota bacterium]